MFGAICNILTGGSHFVGSDRCFIVVNASKADVDKAGLYAPNKVAGSRSW